MRLLLFRHAKSDWMSDHGADHDRPLNQRGRLAALEMGRWIAHHGQKPDAVVASTAARVQETLELATQAGGWSCPVDSDERLYLASVETALEVISEQSPECERLLYVGHQPTCADLLARLVGGGRFRFPTAALASVDLQIESWAQVALRPGELRFLVTPKLLASGPA